MTTLGWIIWVLALGIWFLSLTLLREGRVVGRAALLFAFGTATGLAATLVTGWSKFHLLWILPVALLLSGALAAVTAMVLMRRGIEAAVKEPEFERFLKEEISKPGTSSGEKGSSDPADPAATDGGPERVDGAGERH